MLTSYPSSLGTPLPSPLILGSGVSRYSDELTRGILIPSFRPCTPFRFVPPFSLLEETQTQSIHLLFLFQFVVLLVSLLSQSKNGRLLFSQGDAIFYLLSQITHPKHFSFLKYIEQFVCPLPKCPI